MKISGCRASYANFYVYNHAVIVPTYRCKQDDQAMALLEECFPDRKVIGIDSVEIIWGLRSFPLFEPAGAGSFNCLFYSLSCYFRL